MRRILTVFLLPILAAASLLSCTVPGDPVVGTGNDKATLMLFRFLPSSNPGLRERCVAVDNKDVRYVTVPEGVDLARLVPDIQVSEGASVEIDGVPYESGKAYSFSGNVQKITVTSESGTQTAVYRICVKHGNSAIDNRIYRFMKDFSVPGMALAIMRGTETVYSCGYGFAVEESEERCTADHLFRIADISKVFCTMSIMVLVEQGRIRLNSPVFGEEGVLKGMFESVTPFHESITVKNLLSSSSGLRKEMDDPFFVDYSPADTLIQRALNARPDPYDDGSMLWNAGAGYDENYLDGIILRRIVEVVSRKSYADFLKEDVLSRMGISDTQVGGSYVDERRQNECVYYAQEGRIAYPEPPERLSDALDIISSANELMRILTFIDMDDTVPDIFSSGFLDEMYSPVFQNYGLGWKLDDSRYFKMAHYYDGNIPGTAALLVGDIYPSMSGVILCNTSSYNSNANGSIDDNMKAMLSQFMQYFE